MARREDHSVPYLWQHPNGIWYARWRRTKKRKSLGVQHRLEAKRLLRERYGPVEEGTVTVEDGAHEWYSAKARPRLELSASTLKQYRTFSNRLAEHFADRLLEDVTPRDLEAYLDELEQKRKLTPQGVRKRIALLRQFWTWHIKRGNCLRNPTLALETPRARSVRTPEISEEDYRALVSDLREEKRPLCEQLADMVTVMWFSGLRPAQCARLRWTDIDVEGLVWMVRGPSNKGGEKLQPIHQALIHVLEKISRAREGPFSNRAELDRAWHSFRVRRAQWKDADLRSLRHAFVSRLRNKGLHEEAKRLAGHSTQAMSDHYWHDRVEDLRSALNSL